MPGFNEISPNHVMRLIGTPDCPVLIDVRIAEDIAAAPFLIPSSIAYDFNDLDGIKARIGDQKAIIICHKGKKLSFGVMAALQADGVDAEVLAGGHCAWMQADLPAIPIKAVNDLSNTWVTRHRPKIDRIACPWLLRRFISADTKILFVPPAEVMAVADRFGATSFDMETGPFGHDGELCSFDVMIRDFGLSHPALDRLALVVRAADTNRHDLSPQAAGLLAISAGLSRQYKNDTAQLEAGFTIYDALYRWARDAHEEGHDWPAPTASNQKPDGD